MANQMREPCDHAPAVLLLTDGTYAQLPEYTVRQAVVLVDGARDLGERLGGDIDPATVRGIGCREEHKASEDR